MSERPKGSLVIIGGHEDKEGDRAILKELARRVGKHGRLVVVTAATELPDEVGQEYRAVFGKLGVFDVEVLDIRTRDQAYDADKVAKLDGAAVVFFTGGDQLRITSQIGDSPVFRCMREIFQKGGTLAGTSAGAAAMPETMLINGASDASHKISALGMAPGLALIRNGVIDSHFAERGRIGRLLGAVVQNPRNFGLGIDEDTAIVVEGDMHFEVLGSGAVYVVDGTRISYSSLSEARAAGIVGMDDVTLHVLGEGDRFDLQACRPLRDREQPAATA